MIKFSVLGPLEMRASGHAHQVQGSGQKTMLISLLVSDNRSVSVESLMYELWAGARPDNPENALQANVSRLRRKLHKLEPDRVTSRLSSCPAGYQLTAGDDELDGRTFLAAVRLLEEEVGACRPDVLAVRLRDLLGVWRGPVLGGVLGGPICRAGGERYEQGRLRAYEMLFDAELSSGNHGAIVAEFGTLVTAYSPLQQRFCEQLMVALYRSGRQVDALGVYRSTIDRITEVGATPSARLVDCERAILNHDPMLSAIPGGRQARTRVIGTSASRRAVHPAVVPWMPFPGVA